MVIGLLQPAGAFLLNIVRLGNAQGALQIKPFGRSARRNNTSRQDAILKNVSHKSS
jgi:hypothetical protein